MENPNALRLEVIVFPEGDSRGLTFSDPFVFLLKLLNGFTLHLFFLFHFAPFIS